MKLLLFTAFAALIWCHGVESKTGHAVFAPQYAEPGKTYTVNVLLTREAADTAVTSATVQASLNIAGLPSQQSTLNLSNQLANATTFRFAVPALLAPGTIKLSVSSMGHITFRKQIDVTVQTVRGQIYVQMDKPMYRAGDKLRFIVFGLYNSFLPITERSLNITLEDAGRNLVQRWTNVRNLTSHGVAQYELLLSTQASLGIWRLNIACGDLSGFYDFPVEDYKLSYFEAVVTTNSTYFSREDSNNAVEVVSEGRYQHHSCKSRSNCKTNERGQVTGRVELQVWLLGTGSTKYGSINVTQDVGLGNPAKYVITSAVLNSVVDINLIDRLLIYSKVTEFGTGFTNYANKTMTLIDRVYLLDYPKYINPTIFHTDRDLHLEMTAIKANGQPLSRSEITQLQYETAASCSADDFKNEPLDSLLPSHSIGALASTGIVKLTIHTTDEDLNCPEVFVKVNLQSKSKNPVVVFHSIFQRYTRFASDAQIKISWEDGKHEIRQKKVDDHISFHVDATTAVPVFHWMVVSRGLVFESGVFSEPDLQKETLRLNVSSEHMPRASILVWTTLNDELVADALEFLVVDNTVALDYSTGSSPATDNFGSNAVTQVRSPVALRFDTLPNSFVQWLAIDEKVLIHLQSKISASAVDQSELQGNNDFTPYSSQSLKQNFLDVSRQLVAHFDSLAGVHKDSAPNSYEVFKQSQIIVDTSYTNTNGLPKRSRRSVASYNSNNNAVRVLFPEVFLFENEIAPSSGVSEDTGLTSFIKRYTTPDTMTSWFAAALSVHPTRGLHVSNVVQIPVYHDFYLSIYIPTLTYKCNETVNATVYVHNTRDADVSATLTVSGSANYKAEGRDLNVSVSKNVFVPAKSVVITTFLLQFVVVGRPRIVISAVTSEGLKDALETYVNVKPEGVPVKLETPAFYCWTNTECSTNVVLEPKKECCTQPALGEVIGVITPVFMLPEDAGGENNTDNIPNPEGCCEQMMPDFTELSYLLQTLRRSNKTSPKVEAAATERLQVHLQQYLAKCARSDGSVTSWGNSEANLGSTVLTSFVARTLLVAADLLKDSGALEQAQRSIYWLLGHQEQDDGSFPSYPPNSGLSVPYVWYTQLESGPYADSIATAYTLIAILEQPSISKQFATSHYSKLLAASAYLKKHYGNTKDMHYLSITAYALQLAAMRLDDTQAQSVAAEIVNGLKRRAYSSNGLTFWPYERAPESCNSVITGRIPASASEVELASFISEYYYLNARVPEATPIFRFLLSQRNSQHKLPRMGASTHSTALGQQAIGDYLILANIPVAYSGTVKIQAVGGLSPFSETVVVYENSLTPIEIALPQGTPEVKVMTTAGLTQIYFKTVKYYPNPYHAYTSYRSGVLEIHVISSPTTEKADFATIKVCNSWNRNETSGMIVSMVELPSGFALHSTLQDIQKQHLTADGGSLVGSLEIQNDKNFAIYYNYIQSYKPTCTEVLLRRTINVDNLATAAVRSYNYYESQYIGFELYKLTREPHLPRHHQLDEL